MDLRQQQGLEIAARSRIVWKGAAWSVPSQSTSGSYLVRPVGSKLTCACPDYQTNAVKCKHIWAVEFYRQREEGTGQIEAVVDATPVPKKTYAQNWPAYNAAQTNEKDEFQALLADLCSRIETPAQQKGRPRYPLGDAIFAATLKIYTKLSGRRFMSDLREAHARGHIRSIPHFNTVLNYIADPATMPVLQELIVESSAPLRSVERVFAVDSTGFTGSRWVRWQDEKFRKGGREEHDWSKLHLTCGVDTHIVTAAEIHERDSSDTLHMPSLLKTTARYFDIEEVCADKAYSTVKNHKAIAAVGATPYIAFKSNATGQRGGVYRKAFHFFQLHRDEFLRHYHQRSNVESVMSMIKMKFGDRVQSKSEPAMTNEVLCKVLAHNICCLIQSVYELGIDPGFLMKERAA